MRDIKFRAWQKNTKRMLEVIRIEFEDNKIKTITVKYPQDCIPRIITYGIKDEFDLNALELMQYTGLKDKNGVEIYEGDILYGGVEYHMQYGNVLIGIGECQSTESCDTIDDLVYGVYIKVKSEKLGISQDVASAYTVIGNIHENKELLEVQSGI